MSSQQYRDAEDYAAQMAALHSGPAGERTPGRGDKIILKGKHKGQTPDQVQAHYMAEAATQGLARRSTAGDGGAKVAAPTAPRVPSIGSGSGLSPHSNHAATRAPSPAPAPQPAVPSIAGTAPTPAPSFTPAAQLPQINAPATLQPTIQPTAPAVPSIAGTPPAVQDNAVLAQGIHDSKNGVTSRGTSGETLYANGAAIQPNQSGGRSLTTPTGGKGSVTFGPPTVPKLIEGKPMAQAFANAAKNQGIPSNLPAAPAASTTPAADALAKFNAANPRIYTAQETDAKAAKRQILIAKATDATVGPEAQSRRDGQTATTQTPAGVPAPAATFTTAQKDAYNTSMASLGAAPTPTVPSLAAPAPVVAPAPATTPAPVVARAPVPTQAQRNPEGISAKMGAGTPSPTPAILSNPLGTIGTGIANAASAVGGAVANKAQANPTGIAAKVMSIFPSATSKNIIARAEGGPVSAGQTVLVGERGPELIVPRIDGTVIPNHAISPSALPGLAPLPPRASTGSSAQPVTRGNKATGSNWTSTNRVPSLASKGDWRMSQGHARALLAAH